MFDYLYQIEFKLPDLKLTIDDFISFSVIKTPISKLSPFIMFYTFIRADKYYELLSLYNEKKKDGDYIKGYLDIYRVGCNLGCDLENIKKTSKSEIIVEHKGYYITYLKGTTPLSTVDNKARIYMVSCALVSPHSILLSNLNSLSKVYHSKKVKDIINEFKNILNNLQIKTYEKINYTNHTYDTIHINQNVNLLELPYFLQKYYKITNSIAYYFFDDFSSPYFFNQMNVYKMYDLDSIEKYIKYDMVKLKSALFEMHKEEYLELEKFKKFFMNPKTVVFVKNDGDTITKDIDKKVSIQKAKDKDGKFDKVNVNIDNKYILNLYTPDNPDAALERYKKTRQILSKIEKIARVSIPSIDFRYFDLGIIYKTTKRGKYDTIFHNIVYNFKKVKSLSTLLSLEVIGDMITFNL